jgi:hypothetical protein
MRVVAVRLRSVHEEISAERKKQVAFDGAIPVTIVARMPYRALEGHRRQSFEGAEQFKRQPYVVSQSQEQQCVSRAQKYKLLSLSPSTATPLGRPHMRKNAL